MTTCNADHDPILVMNHDLPMAGTRYRKRYVIRLFAASVPLSIDLHAHQTHRE